MLEQIRHLKSYLPLAVFLVVACVLPIAYRLANQTADEEDHRALLEDLRAIEPVERSAVVKSVDTYSAWRPHNIVVGNYYGTSALYYDVHQHYQRQLELYGWKWLVSSRGNGVRIDEYCKGPHKASLQYADSSEFGWTYAFEISTDLGFPKCAQADK